MWQIVKTELNYNKYSIIFLFLILCLYSLIEYHGNYLFELHVVFFVKLYQTLLSFMIIAYIIWKSMIRILKEKTDQRYINLPLSLTVVSVLRSIIQLFPFLFIILYFSAIQKYFLSSRISTFFTMGNYIGPFIVAGATFIVLRDVYHFLIQQRQKKIPISIMIIFVFVFLTVWFFLTGLGYTNYYKYKMLEGILYLIYLSIVGTISGLLYFKRRSYLQEGI
jgi:hypothetical protein